ncbi:hypothetical protein OIU84_028516 [Salix udensis]|uniref:Potassium channel n=1 Tax=Salix udensis TaxID=889485 RepID=A0AAD6KCS2_9ROSI|nr:hypothetical protein OIU84_028516 [Salix udensis]
MLRWYRAWTKFILLWAVYSSFFTPLEFGFFRGLPENLFILDIVGQVAFLLDIIFQFFIAYRDSQTYRTVYKRAPIALRYLKSHFIIDLLACLPWDIIYKALNVAILIQSRSHNHLGIFPLTQVCGHKEEVSTLPSSQEGYTWIGSLKMGYGDIHAVNLREMIFVMIYVSFDMILGAYLIGNMTALIVKGSKTERFRDKMTDLIKYMNRNRLGKEIRNQIKGHVRLQYESSYTEASALQDLPISIRAKVSQTLYTEYIEKVPLLKGCSAEFINQIVIRLHEEFFLPGEVIMEQGNVVDQFYFVCHGVLEEVGIGQDGSEETVKLLPPNSSFGEISILCNIPQPYTVRVCELCRLLRIDKQSFSNILEIYFYDGRKILDNLLEGKESNLRDKQLESDITFHIGKQEAELALRVNNAAYHGDLYQLKGFIRAGADPNKTDYDGRSPLHLAASRGYEDITLFLIQEGVDINIKDKFGNTPLAVARGDSDFLKRVLSNGIDPNSKDYDHRTPLHVAASEGLYLMAKLLIEAGACVFSKDRWGNTPLDEGRMCGSKNLIKLLEEAKSSQKLDFHYSTHETREKVLPKKCTIFPFHPRGPEEQRRPGVVLWVPNTMEELVKEASEQLQFPDGSCILTEDAGKILDVKMIDEGQKLYLTSDRTHQLS